MSETRRRPHVNASRRAICFTVGLLLALGVATQLFVGQRRAITLEAGPVLDGWRLRFEVPRGWRDLGSTTDVFGWQTRHFRSQRDSGVLVFRRLRPPSDTTADSLCRWALSKATLGLARSPEADLPTQETRLDGWRACEMEIASPPTRLSRGWRCRVLGALKNDTHEEEPEAYTVELLIAGGRESIDEALWRAVTASLAIVEREP